MTDDRSHSRPSTATAIITRHWMGPDFLTFNFLSTENEMKATRKSPDTTYTILCFSRMGIGKYTTFRIVNICGQTHKIRPKRNKQEQRMVWQSVVAAWLSDGGGDVGCCCCYFVYMSIKMPPVEWVLVHGNESTIRKTLCCCCCGWMAKYITHIFQKSEIHNSQCTTIYWTILERYA